MSATGSWPAQKAIFAALTADPDIIAPASGVYDHVPEDAEFPLVVVGEGKETDASTFDQRAHLVEPEVQIWTRDGEASKGSGGAAGYRVGLEIAEKIVAALLDDSFAVEGHDTIVMPLEEMTKERPSDTDPSLRLVSPKFKMLLEDQS